MRRVGYYSLHNHTDASNARLIDCINKTENLIQQAFDLGLSGVAITDHETIKAHVKASNFIKKKKGSDEQWQNFKLIYGNEIYLCRNGLSAENYDSKKDKFYHFILLALDEEGHEQIRQLSTRAYGHSFMRSRMLRVPTYYKDIEEVVGKNPGHLIASSACLGSFIGTKLLQSKGKPEIIETVGKIKSWISYICSIFEKDNFFLELQPSLSKEQIFVNKCLVQLSKEMNIPAIITTDSHFGSKEERPIHKAYLNSKEGEREVDAFYASAYLMDGQEIHSYLDDALGEETVQLFLNNTKIIGERVKEFYLERPFKLPYLPSNSDVELSKNRNFQRAPNEKRPEVWEKFIQSEEAADRVFIHRVLKKCNSDPEQFFSEKSIDQIETELDTVWQATKKQNIIWSKYFLQVADYIDIAWNEGDTLCGVGRGSGGGFYLNYLLDITQANPLREPVKTYYWRYLNPERVSILDTDTDIQSNRRNKVIKALQKRYGEQRVVRVMTEKTEASKSAILTAARGLEIDNDIAQYIASLITSDRGKQRSLHDTYYGNEEEGFASNKTFIEQMEKYPQLWEVAQRIEGLANGVSSHAGGVIIVDEDITKTNSLIKLNSGEWATAWDLHESESAGGNVKIDLLATMNLTRIRTCLDLLVEYGYIEKKATLKETYEAAIGVYNLERDDPKMWEMVKDNKVVSLFQFETEVGRQGIELAAPQSIADLCALNSIIRLMATEKGGELPVEKFARFKQDHKYWEQEMDSYGLTEDEKKIIRKHLTTSHGINESQESMMSLIQEPEIAGWTLKQADYLRKSVAKKDKKLYEQLTKEFYKNAKEKNLSPTITKYFWEVLVKTQAGYSFCAAHCLFYSLIGLQNINLAYRYPIIFWNTANLIVDSSGAEESEDEEKEEAEVEEEENNEKQQEEVVDIYEPEDWEDYEYIDAPDRKTKVKRAKKTVNYGKVASAIGKFKSRGITILPPNINESSFTFSPNVENNSITYGLRGLSRISTEVINEIIANRPYTSLDDFLSKVKVNKTQMLVLIKSGAFDSLYPDRMGLLNEYVERIAGTKHNLTLANIPMLIKYDVLADGCENYIELYQYNKFIRKHLNKDTGIIELPEKALEYYMNHFDTDKLISQNEIMAKDWEKQYKKEIAPLAEHIKENKEEMIQELNRKIVEEQFDLSVGGNISHCEMEAMSFYYHPHELMEINRDKYEISRFADLPEEPPVEREIHTKDGKDIVLYELAHIAGTVVDKNKLKNSITLLTPDGVVNVKIWKNQYAKYDKQISEIGSDGKKKVRERSWFKRGTLLYLQGVRRGQNFIPKAYKGSRHKIPIMKIIAVEGSDIVYTDKRYDE